MEPATGYREWRLSGPLAATFGAVWISGNGRSTAAGGEPGDAPTVGSATPGTLLELPEPHLILPDGHADLIWLGDVWCVAGPDLTAQDVSARSAALTIGFRFQPGVAADWLRQPLDTLVNQRVPLADIIPARARQFASSPLGEPNSVSEVVAAMESLAVREASPVEPRMLAAYAMLDPRQAAERTDLAALAARLGCSERTMRRQFVATFGYGPRAMGRVLRFQHFLNLAIAAPSRSLSELAFATGYADQAHLTRECQSLARQTPAALVRSRRNPAALASSRSSSEGAP